METNLNNDCLRIILDQCHGYSPFTSQVCKQWRDVSKSSHQRFDIEILVKNNDIKLLDWMNSNREFTPKQINTIFLSASRVGNIEILRLYKDRYNITGATRFDLEMANAAVGGHLECMKLCKEWGATDFNWSMNITASGGHLECMKLCKDSGATNFDTAMWFASVNEQTQCVQLLQEWINSL